MYKDIKKRLKSILPSGLLSRTMLIIIAPVLLLQLTTAVVFFDRHWIKMTDRLTFAVAGEMAAIADQIERSEDKTEALAVMQRLMASHLEILISYNAGEVLEQRTTVTKGLGLEENLALALETQIRRPFYVDINFKRKRVHIKIELADGVLEASMPERRLYSSSGYIFILWMVGLSCFFFAIAGLMMRNQIRPILRLSVAADRLGKGRDVSFFKASGAKEVRQASEAFMRMRDRIRRQIEQRTAMLAGVSHDLRTPITRLKLQTEMIEGLPEKDLKDMRADLAEMDRMIDAYLAFAKGEDDEPDVQVNIHDMVRDIIARFENTLSEGQTIDMQDTDAAGILVYLRLQQMSRVFSNIVSNALRYAHNLSVCIYQSSMMLDANGQEENIVIIEFDDDGQGIPLDERENVFRPFYRIDYSRNKKSGGVGLGLSIAQDIVHGHGGEITLSESPLGGLRVRVILPL
jgi:two-component system osmolarity sensor histidine kinase EnvZ